jgi:copper chaperone CopZ
MNGVWAKADLETKKVTVRSKTELNTDELSAKINEAGYTVLEIL